MKQWRNWHYKNTTLLVISLATLAFFIESDAVHRMIQEVGKLGYFGAFITGIFFTSVFTIAPAGVLLFHLATVLHPVEVAILAGLGAMVGDYGLSKLLKDRIFQEWAPVFQHARRNRIVKLFRTPHFAWLLPVLGALIIASPLPDEPGIGMLSASHLRRWQFMVLTFVVNVLGIFLIVAAAKLI